MEKLLSTAYEKLQIEKNVQSIKALHNSIGFQSTMAVFMVVGILTWLHIRPLALVFSMIFCFWFYKNYSTLRVELAPELETYIQVLQQRVVEIRQNKPTMFCIVASGCLGALAVLGHFVSGSIVVLTGLILAAIISTKYNFKILKVEPKALSFTWVDKVRPEFELDDEFFPEENETNMFVLERASDLASLTLAPEDGENDEDKSDEIPSELLIPDSIPEIDENSTDDDHDDLLPIVTVSKSESHIKYTKPARDELLIYSQSNDNIEFKKGYFKYGSSEFLSSSSSEESLSSGLKFPDHTAIDGPSRSGRTIIVASTPMPSSDQEEDNDLITMAVKSQTQALLSNSSKIIPSLVSGLVQGVFRVGVDASSLATTSRPVREHKNRRFVTALDSSDESDFELLDQEDFQ